MPDGNGARVHAVTKSSYNSANNHLRNGIRRSLKSGTDRKHDAANHNTLPSTELFAEEEAEYGTEETALISLMSDGQFC